MYTLGGASQSRNSAALAGLSCSVVIVWVGLLVCPLAAPKPLKRISPVWNSALGARRPPPGGALAPGVPEGIVTAALAAIQMGRGIVLKPMLRPVFPGIDRRHRSRRGWHHLQAAADETADIDAIVVLAGGKAAQLADEFCLPPRLDRKHHLAHARQ